MPKLEQITSHIAVDTDTQKTTRSCVIGGIFLGNDIVAVDSGSTLEIGKSLRRDLESAFNTQVSHLFLTHTHTDHRLGMSAFNDVALILSRKSMENMPTTERLKEWSVKPFDRRLVLNGDDLNVEFLLVGGHSVGSSIAWVPEEKVVFGGDLFFTGDVNYGLPTMYFYQNKPKKTGNPDEYIAAYEMFRQMRAETIVPGHGDIVYNAQEYLESHLSFFKDLRSFIILSIDEGKSPEEIELPRLPPMERAYAKAEHHPQMSNSLRWLNHYLELLKISFYNHYSD